MPKISEERRAAMRTRLVDAAIEVVEAKGPGAATTRAILEQAGLSAGALYHYFSSKDELFLAVADRFIEVDPTMGTDLPADAEGLVAWQMALLDDLFAIKHHNVLPQLRMQAGESALLRKTLHRYDRQAVERAGALNRQCQAAGLFRPEVDADALVELVEAFWEGFILRDRLDAFESSRSRVLAQFYELLIAATLTDSPAADAMRARLRAATATDEP